MHFMGLAHAKKMKALVDTKALVLGFILLGKLRTLKRIVAMMK